MITQYQLVPGSIAALAQEQGKSIAETFVSADCVVLMDVSGSMSSCDSRGMRSRYEVGCEELATLQRTLPGKIAVVSFANQAQFCPAGVPTPPGGGTNLAGALRFVKIADVTGMQFVVISDGYPDGPEAALAVAREYANKISTIYVGPEEDERGRWFLAELARVSGGVAVTAARAVELGAGLERLLLRG